MKNKMDKNEKDSDIMTKIIIFFFYIINYNICNNNYYR